MAIQPDVLSARLEASIANLDIPLELVDEAILEFEQVATWLREDTSELAPFAPYLYPQGSFRLGTPVRPLARSDFDIDMVCRLLIEKEQTTQKELKSLVGNRLRAHPDLKNRLEESRRCWTLNYKPDFHLDILPSLPDPQHTTGILITDKELFRWQFSNPIGYAEWFYGRMGASLQEERAAVAQSQNVQVDEVPEWRVRTPLQRAVQALKRHRDVRFQDEPDRCPISIIITTLAARAYRPQPDFTTLLLDLSDRMPLFVEKRNDQWWVENPAHPNENFADKWNEYPERRDAFLAWMLALKGDLRRMIGAPDETGAARMIVEGFQIRPAPLAEAPVYAYQSVPALADTSHIQPPLWPVRLAYRCTVSTDVHRGYRSGKRLYSLKQATYKGVGLRFLASTDTPEPYEVRWQVSNTGEEARQAGQLRGQFEQGEGKNGTIRWEHTAYKGTHLVEAFVIKSGIVVARSGTVRVRVAR